MTRKQKDGMLLKMSLGCFLAMSASFLLMPVEALGRAPGILFWIGLITGVTLQIILESRRRAFFAGYRVQLKKFQKRRNGLLSFGCNKAAKVVDVLLPVALIGIPLSFALTNGTGYVCYVSISAALFLLCLHCILNGRIYFHVKNQNKIQQALEQRKVSTHSKGEGET